MKSGIMTIGRSVLFYLLIILFMATRLRTCHYGSCVAMFDAVVMRLHCCDVLMLMTVVTSIRDCVW